MLKVDHIRDLQYTDISSILDKAQTQARDNKGDKTGNCAQIKINHNTFNVSIVTDKDGFENIKLTFASGNRFTNSFRKKTLARAQAALESLYCKNYGTCVQRPEDDSYGEKEAKLYDNFANDETALAHYGFGKVRRLAMDVCLESVNQNKTKNVGRYTIDAFNDGLGLAWMKYSDWYEGPGDEAKIKTPCKCIEEFVNRLGNPESAQEGNLEDSTSPIPKEAVGKWREFLQNKDGLKARLNIVDRFKKYQKESDDATTAGFELTGWAGMIQKLGIEETLKRVVIKNLWGITEDEAKECADILLKMMDEKVTTAEGRDKILWSACVDNYGTRTGKGQKLACNMTNLFSAFLFRQTSKLGLEFFAENKIPIVFQRTDPGKKHISSEELNDKWWKTGDLKTYKPEDHPYGSPITHSELRHLNKKGIPGKTRVLQVG